MTGADGRAQKKYIPAKNSGGYALLITLLRAYHKGKQHMMKKELIEEADKSGLSSRPIRDNAVGWTAGRPNSKDIYSGWSNMGTLIQKFLVVKSSNPAKYKLTDEGKSVAQQCMERAGLTVDNCYGHETGREEEQSVSPARQESGKSSSGRQASSSSDEDVQEIRGSDLTSRDTRRRGNNFHTSSSPTGERSAKVDNMDLSRDNYGHCSKLASQIQGNVTAEIGSVDPDFELAVPPLEAGEKFSDVYEIICILDNREQFRRQTHTHLQNFVESLMTQFEVKVETRKLPVGDTLWIARHKEQNEEYVLDFVVERKSVKDLWQSIKDNRYKQQKLRLMSCGLACRLYLVEGDVNSVESTEALKTAMFTTELHGGFRLLKTDDPGDTCRQYGHLTKAIIRRYNLEIGKGGTSRLSKTYKDFVEHCKDVVKDRVKDVFCRQLTQIGQVTEEIALSIQDRYPTLLSIAEAFEQLEGNQEAQEKLLQGIPIRNTSKTVSAVMSKNVYKAIWAPI